MPTLSGEKAISAFPATESRVHKKKLEEARNFLADLAEKPPWLPYEPALLPMLFSATREDSKATIDDITALIERSQKLASRVLAIANSAMYALESTVTTLKRAVSILGLREVRTVVIMVGAISAIKGAKLPKRFDEEKIWLHHLRTAAIAKALTTYLNDQYKKGRIDKKDALGMDPDEAYVTGLLHDIGKVFLAAVRPDIWEKIEEIRKDVGISFAEAEDAYWGMDHALVGAQVLHYWKIPLLITDPINWHHAPNVAPAYRAETAMLSAADMIANSPDAEHGDMPCDALLLLPQGIDPGQIAAVVKRTLADKRLFRFNSLLD